MTEAIGDIWQMPDNRPYKNAICITTNNVIKMNGAAVMGRGIAKEANDRFHVNYILARHLQKNGNCVGVLGHFEQNGHAFYLLSFPTKWHWKNPSDYALIQTSAKEVVQKANELGLEHIYLTQPGCGNGGLYWPDVKKRIEPILDRRFTVVRK